MTMHLTLWIRTNSVRFVMGLEQSLSISNPGAFVFKPKLGPPADELRHSVFCCEILNVFGKTFTVLIVCDIASFTSLFMPAEFPEFVFVVAIMLRIFVSIVSNLFRMESQYIAEHLRNFHDLFQTFNAFTIYLVHCSISYLNSCGQVVLTSSIDYLRLDYFLYIF